MAPAPLRNPPARPWTGSGAGQPRKTRRKDQKQKQKPVALLSSTPCVDGSNGGAGARLAANGGAPSWPGFSANSRFWGWPGGWVAQGTLQVRPCKLVGAIHGACAPAQPTRPALDRVLRAPATKDKKKRSKAEAEAGRFALIHAWRGWIHQISQHIRDQSPLRSNGIRPRAVPTDRGKLSGVGRCGLAGPQAPWMAPTSPHGRVYGVSCKPAPPHPTLG